MQIKIKKEINALDALFGTIKEFAESNQLENTFLTKLDLIVEEIFTNFVKYNSHSKNDILLKLQKGKKHLLIQMTDFDVEPFDVTKSKQPDIHQSIKERKVGGLGLHLVKQFAEKIDYRYENRNSTIIILLKLET